MFLQDLIFSFFFCVETIENIVNLKAVLLIGQLKPLVTAYLNLSKIIRLSFHEFSFSFRSIQKDGAVDVWACVADNVAFKVCPAGHPAFGIKRRYLPDKQIAI